MNQATPDPVIDEIREIRHAISARYDHDPTKLLAFLMQFQQQFQDRLIYDPSGEFIAGLMNRCTRGGDCVWAGG